MFSRSRIALVLALLLSLILAVPVFAGGWAIISLDELPTNVIAGEPLRVGFTVLQHGQTPMTGLTPTISVSLPNEAEFVVNAKPDGKPGHYNATLIFPKEGDWNWSIQAFTMNQKMPVLSVVVPLKGQPVSDAEPVVNASPFSPLLVIRLSVLGIGIVGLVLAMRRKSRFAMVLTGLCLLVGIGSFVMAPAVPSVEAQSKSSLEVMSKSSISQVELGRQLFIAKGCITCHANAKVGKYSDYGNIDVGAPNLTNFSANPKSLRLWLKDPSAVKSDTWMPNLDLSDAEIEALIAFINSK